MTTSIESYKTPTAVAKAENPALSPFIQAFDSPKVKDSDDLEISKTLNTIISTSVFSLGQSSKSDADMVMTIQALLPDVKMFFGNLTLQELKLAAHRGVLGMYGDNYGVNVAQISKWFNSYMGDMQRHEAKKALIDAKVQETFTSVSEEEIAKNRKEIILKAFEKYKSTGMYEDHGNYVYECLKKSGVISYTGKEVREFILEAIGNLKSKKSLALTDCTDLSEGRKLKREIEYLSQEEFQITPEITAEAKRLMLYARFDELILEGEDLGI